MTDTLFDLTYEVAGLCASLDEGIATNGTDGTIVDTDNRADDDDDLWNGGTVWILEADGADPEGEWSRIDDFVKSTSTIDLRATLSDDVAVGDRYAIINNEFTLDIIIAAINSALRLLGPIRTIDTTSITIESSKTEYELPLAAKRDLRKVYLQTNTADSDDNDWVELFNWYPLTGVAGSVSTLVLPSQYESGRELLLEYMAPHSKLYLEADKLNEVIPMERVIYRAAAEAQRAKFRATRIEYYVAEIQHYADLATEMELLYEIEDEPIKPGRLNLVGGNFNAYPGDRNPR